MSLIKQILCVIFICLFFDVSALTYNSYSNRYVRQQQTDTYKNLTLIFSARNIEFAFPNEGERRLAIQNQRYISTNVIPIDVDVYYPPLARSGKIFITIPRFVEGIPYSLAYMTNVLKENGPEFQPYPSYDWHSSYGSDCNGLTSVFRIQIDTCGQMWILDSGEIGFTQFCPPQLVVVDLQTHRLVHRYRLPKSMYKTNISRFVNIIVDVADPAPLGKCKSAFVYMADPLGFSIIVYDIAKGLSWRIENKHTYPNPIFGTHTIAGVDFELLDGVFGMAVTPRGLSLKRMLYFHSLTSDTEVAVPLEVINNASLWQNDDTLSTALDKFIVLGQRNVQCGASAMSKFGYLLCGFLDPIGIFSWDIRTPYTFENRLLIAENPKTLQFVSGLKIVTHPSGKEDVWILSNRLQKAFTNTLNFNEINFRLQRCGLNELLTGQNCLV